jgi:N-acetyl sugar amidotransferase
MTTTLAPTIHQRCTHCVMDTTDPAITFDEDGRCSHCRDAEIALARLPRDDAETDARLAEIAERIRAAAPDDEYQCLVGLSGGVDSSYVALQAARLGLRVLAVHFDNGWNSEIAVSNIEKLCTTLDLDLVTEVIDWREFRDLQRSFLLASVIDVELVTDHAIFATMLRLAREHGIRYVLSGNNAATESILPRAWVWPKQDKRNIAAIHERFGSVPLTTFPTCGIVRWGMARYAGLGPRYVELLNALRFRKDEAMAELEAEVGWRYYGGKHYESTFTRWYQAHLLPEKFGVDKRLAHLSSLVANGELGRDEALAALDEPLYEPGALAEDEAFVAKKLGFTAEELDAILAAEPVPHDAYPSSGRLLRALSDARRAHRARSHPG